MKITIRQLKWPGALRLQRRADASMPTVKALNALTWIGPAVVCTLTSCRQQQPDPSDTFYTRTIDPILQSGCATSPTGSACHLLQDTRGNALGNLSLDSFQGLSQRRDLFASYGPYAIPGLLLKALPPFEVPITRWDSDEPIYITTDIAHAGGRLLEVTSVSYSQLRSWIEDGASENNAPVSAAQAVLDAATLSPCNPQVGSDPLFDPEQARSGDDSEAFNAVNSILGQRCGAGNCHGSTANSLYLTCGETEEQLRWNYFAAEDYVSSQTRNSDLLRKALAPSQGGTFHEGGTVFETETDPGYEAILQWAETKGGPTRLPEEPGFAYFSERVQPMLVKRGCMQLGCHSPSMGHDYRLRGGSAGHFSLPATRTNYELSLAQIALESPNPNTSRLISKNLPPVTGQGMVHRGGSLFAGMGEPSACDFELTDNGPIDAQDPYCVLVSWIRREQQSRLDESAKLHQLLYVQRPNGMGPDTIQDFEGYFPGAQLMRTTAQVTADGWVSIGESSENLLELCNLPAEDSDIRRPSVSWDGTQVAFAARTGAADPLQVYLLDETGCTPHEAINAPAVDDTGNAIEPGDALIHNFDPTFSPSGNIVFASTRGNTSNTSGFSYRGPQRSPADPRRLNANLYVHEPQGVRQLTFLLDQELSPSFMNDGRLIFTAEKRSPGFYQLAARRMNLDGGDYHPLYAQRGSIGYEQMSEVVELSNKNFVGIVSDTGAARGAGALAVVNRSVGIDQTSTNPSDYPVDPSAINYPNPQFYQRSLRILDRRATGRIAETRGAYLNPSPLPNGKFLVSFSEQTTSLTEITGSFALWTVDSISGERRPLLESSDDLLWPTAIYRRAARTVYRSRLDEPNGATEVFTDSERNRVSDITYLDLPLLTSLLFQNTRSGRALPEPGEPVQFWEQLPPEPGVIDYRTGEPYVQSDAYGSLYVRRRLLGEVLPNPNDGSAHVQLTGGIPFNLAVRVQLQGDTEPTLHHQREANQFYPGEWARQSFPRELFDGICGNCHGSVSGLEADVAANPDILTRASDVAARGSAPVRLLPTEPPQGPPFP